MKMNFKIYQEDNQGLVKYLGEDYGCSAEEIAAAYIGGAYCDPKNLKKSDVCELLGWPDDKVIWYTAEGFLTKIGVAC